MFLRLSLHRKLVPIEVLCEYLLLNLVPELDGVDAALVRAALWKRSRQSEVADLCVAVGLNQYIGRFEIPVHDVGLVQEAHGAEGAVNDLQQVVLGEINLVLQNLVEVGVDELHDQADGLQVRKVDFL